jgi:hypothetical protein
MDLQELISRLAVALGIGLLIGLERGWRRRQASPGSRAAGIRTFAISGLLGGVIAALAQPLSSQASGGAASAVGAIVLGFGFAAYAAVITVFTRDENRAVGAVSATTAIAGMLTFALGAYALLGDLRIAVGAAVAAAGLLAFREELHGWVEKITWPELQSGLVLLAMTFLGLPILPDNPIGPFGGVNPREVWDHRHRPRRRLIPRLCGGEVFRDAARASLGCRSRRARVFNRSDRRQCTSRCRG